MQTLLELYSFPFHPFFSIYSALAFQPRKAVEVDLGTKLAIWYKQVRSQRFDRPVCTKTTGVGA